MARIWFRLSLLSALAFVLTLPGFAQRVHPPSKRPKHKVAAPVPPPAPAPEPQPQAPPPPPKPFEMPAVPPQVSFAQGQLLIVAQNSTLTDILNEVHKATGATIDIASGDTSERVVGRIGPGLARDVLTDLLNGSKFNYVMLSPSGDAAALDKVILTPKTVTLTAAAGPAQGAPAIGGSSPNVVFTPAPQGTTPNRTLLQQLQPQVMPVQSQPPAPTVDEDNADNEDQDQSGQPAPPQAQAPEAAPQPQNPATMQEQMIQELQRRYQDRVNMQQKQTPTPPPPPPPN